MVIFLRNYFPHKIRFESSFLRIGGSPDPKYTSVVCHSLKISQRLNLENAKIDDFRNFETNFCKHFLIPGETETRYVHSRVR